MAIKGSPNKNKKKHITKSAPITYDGNIYFVVGLLIIIGLVILVF